MTKRELPRHCYRKPGGGLYFQRRGYRTVRIGAEFGTPEFWAEYALVLRGTPTPPAGRSFKALVTAYRASRKWTDLAPRTRADYGKVLDYIVDTFGHLPADRMQTKDVIRAQTVNADQRRFANYIVQVLRIILGHARDLGWITTNPAQGVRLLPKPKAEAEREAWPAAKVQAFRAAFAYGTAERLLFELMLGTGQRPSDCLRMRWDDLEEGGVRVRQQKTAVRLWVPLTPQLHAALDATPKVGLTIAAHADGRPVSYRAMAARMQAARAKIGAEAWDNHGLRFTAAAELAAAGCTDEQIAAVTGHRSLAMVAKYAGNVRQIRRAKDAQGRRK